MQDNEMGDVCLVQQCFPGTVHAPFSGLVYRKGCDRERGFDANAWYDACSHCFDCLDRTPRVNLNLCIASLLKTAEEPVQMANIINARICLRVVEHQENCHAWRHGW